MSFPAIPIWTLPGFSCDTVTYPDLGGDMPFLHSPAEVVQWLAIQEAGDTVVSSPLSDPLGSWPAYATGEPGTPDNCITFFDTTGTEDGASVADSEVWMHEGVQLRVRAKNHREGYLKASLMRDWMKSLYQKTVTIDGTTYFVHNFGMISNVIPNGKEPNISKRNIFTVNVTVKIRALD